MPQVPGAPIVITGWSDDIVEIDGGIYEEFDTSGTGKATVTCSNGVVLDIEFDRDRDGCWRIEAIENPEGVTIERAVAGPDNDDALYSDKAILGDDVTWVECNGEKHHR